MVDLGMISRITIDFISRLINGYAWSVCYNFGKSQSVEGQMFYMTYPKFTFSITNHSQYYHNCFMLIFIIWSILQSLVSTWWFVLLLQACHLRRLTLLYCKVYAASFKCLILMMISIYATASEFDPPIAKTIWYH